MAPRIGDVDAALFERPTRAEIEAEVKRCVDTAVRYYGRYDRICG